MCVCGEEGVGGGVYNCALGVYKLTGFFFCVKNSVYVPQQDSSSCRIVSCLLTSLIFCCLVIILDNVVRWLCFSTQGHTPGKLLYTAHTLSCAPQPTEDHDLLDEAESFVETTTGCLSEGTSRRLCLSQGNGLLSYPMASEIPNRSPLRTLPESPGISLHL